MIFAEEIEKISYSDVVAFCNQRNRENINLDYKREIDASVVKTIAAMANTWGGLIIVGVEDEDSKPKLPVTGIPYEEHLRERVNNLVLGNITPPIFPEIQVCQSDDNQKAFVVIRVIQSNLSPHAIKNNTKIYIRTDTSNEPEELASIDRVLWLVDKRNKSSDLKNIFYTRADKRFETLSKKAGTKIEHSEFTISMCPLYPFEILIDYQSLQRDIPFKIRVNGWGYSFPLYTMSHSELQPIHEGTYALFVNDQSGYVHYEEMNHYGYFYHREDFGHSKKNEGEEHMVHFSYLYDVLTRIDMFLESMALYYSDLGYWGLLDLRISFNKLDDVTFRDLPVPRGYTRFDDISPIPIDKKLEFKKELSFHQIKQGRVQLVVDLVREISWALGFSHIKSETIELLMKENNRLK